MGAWDEKIPGMQNPINNSPLLQLFAKMQEGGLGMPQGGGQPGGMLSPARVGSLNPGPQQPGQGSGSTGGASMIPAPGQMTSTARPQIPYVSQNGFSDSGARKEGLIADSISSIFNTVQSKKQQNEQKQYIEAENTWNQLLSANQALQQNPQDQQAHAIIDTILSDKKRMKAVEESLHIFMPKEGGGEEQTPASQGAQSAVKKFGHKLDQMLKAQTQAQQMAQSQGPKPNTPGGYMWSMPQDNPIQAAERGMMNDPAIVQEAARKGLGLPSAADTAKIAAETVRATAEAEHANAQTQLALEQVKQQGPLAQARMDAASAQLIKANAYANHMRKLSSGQGGTNPKVIEAWVKKFHTGELTNLSQVPVKIRSDVVMGLDGVPIQQKFTASQQAAWDALPATQNMVGDLRRSLATLKQKHPEYFASDFVSQAKTVATSTMYSQIYQHHALVPDPDYRQMMKDVAFITVNGQMAFSKLGRNLAIFEQISKHLPQIGDSPGSIEDKVEWLDNKVVKAQRDALTDYKYHGQVKGISEWQQQQQKQQQENQNINPPNDEPIVITPGDMQQ